MLFGKSGVAWGTGLAGQNESGLRKKERDGRAPAGVFEIGRVFGYDPQLPPGADYPYHQVTEADVWSDDPQSPNYNRHIVIDPKNPPTITRTKECARAISPITGLLRSGIIPIRQFPGQGAQFFSIFGVVLIGRPLAVRRWPKQTW